LGIFFGFFFPDLLTLCQQYAESKKVSIPRLSKQLEKFLSKPFHAKPDFEPIERSDLPALKNELNSERIFQVVVGPSDIGKTWAYKLAAEGRPYVAYVSLRGKKENTNVTTAIAMQLAIPEELSSSNSLFISSLFFLMFL